MTNADMSYLSPEVELIGHDYDLIDAAVTTSPGEYLVVWEDGPGNPERTVYKPVRSTWSPTPPTAPSTGM